MILAADEGKRREMGGLAREVTMGATWDNINNTVAWRMADTIAAREARQRQHHQLQDNQQKQYQQQEQEELLPKQLAKHQYPLPGTISTALLARVVLDARIVSGMALITACWVATGLYMVFTESAMWLRARAKGSWVDDEGRGSWVGSGVTSCDGSREGSPVRIGGGLE